MERELDLFKKSERSQAGATSERDASKVGAMELDVYNRVQTYFKNIGKF